MIEKTINLVKRRLQKAIANKQTLKSFWSDGTYSSTMRAVKRIEEKLKTQPDLQPVYDEIKEMFKQANSFRVHKKDKSGIKSEDTEKEFGYEVEQIRDDEDNISSYKFTIKIRDKAPIIGTLSRDEMQLIYRLYSNYGSKLTQREVSRFFPEYSLEDFKRILRAFNITKASSPFAPHMIEETPKDELLTIQFREKENDFLRSLESERIKRNEIELKKQIQENVELKERIEEIPNFIKDLDLSNLPKADVSTQASILNKSLIIWISDMHIGAEVSSTSDYKNVYNEEEVNKRLDKILSAVSTNNCKYDKVIVCNLGDSIDGMDSQTCRKDHYLPQNMDNKEQFHAFIRCMVRFMSSIITNLPANEYEYYCVGSSNHGGDFDWAANIALAQILGTMNIIANVSDTFISHFSIYDSTYILCHGKDSRDMKSNLPLTLNDKTITYVNTYIDYNNLHNNITFVKGDLHQSATTYCNFFKYKSVGSIFGSSEWIHKNFGNTKACCDYTIVDANNQSLDGLIQLQ